MFSYKNTIKLLTKTSVRYVCIKYKHKDSHWSIQQKKNATGKALDHFDDFYKNVYGKSWSSIRQGLTANHKYVAVVNNYSDNEETMTQLENSGAINMRTLFNLEKGYIKERQKSSISKLDEKLETTEQITIQVETQMAQKQILKVASMAESLKTAEIDNTRIIQPGITDLSSAMYQFVPCTKLKGKEDWIPETQHYKYYENSNSFNVKVEQETDLHFPEHLNVYCYEKSNNTSFESPSRGSTDVLNYYLLDGGSILPVLALGLKPGHRFLDLCAAPGGKSLIAIQTLYPEIVVCNDVEYSRVKRIFSVLRQYLYDLDDRWLSTSRLKILQQDGRYIELNGFDSILVDVPCTNDRLSVNETDNNWFKASRTKERLQLPETQAALLFNALKIVKIGGTVVYSTCSLSPIQNDGVVNMALKQIWEETNIEFTVKDLSVALQAAECCYKFSDQNLLRYGHLVVPYLPQNYGPMYFCKLVRTK